MKTRHTLIAALVLGLTFTAHAGCSDDVDLCTLENEGAYEKGGPSCCSGGCGSSTEAARDRICKNGEFKCEGSAPVLVNYCAYSRNACRVLTACAQTVGLNKTEDLIDNGKVPELCCDLNCNGKKAAYRVCKSGLKFECPGGAVPISRCKDPNSACKGVLQRYRDNGNKIPADMV